MSLAICPTRADLPWRNVLHRQASGDDCGDPNKVDLYAPYSQLSETITHSKAGAVERALQPPSLEVPAPFPAPPEPGCHPHLGNAAARYRLHLMSPMGQTALS